jgi:hypothetical protein
LRTRAGIALASCFAVSSGMSVMCVSSGVNGRGSAPMASPTGPR